MSTQIRTTLDEPETATPCRRTLDRATTEFHTFGMKVAVSIPDPIFAEAEALAKRRQLPRSKLYARALSEYVAKHSEDTLTDTMNAALDTIGERPDPFVQEAGRRILKSVEW